MIIADLHNDTAYELYFGKKTLKDGELHINLKKQNFSKNLLFYAIYMNPKKYGDAPKAYFENIYNYFKNETQKNKDEIEFFSDIKTFLKGNKHNAVMTLEGGDFITELSDISYLLKFDIRAVTLTWNFSNKIASSHTAEIDDGLSSFGYEIIKKMEEENIVPDLSHSSDKTFYDVIKTAKKPILVSHSNSRELCNNTRNITDDMFFALKDNNGLLGINFYSEFLGEKSIFSHIEHFLSLGGEDNIAFGSDFDGMDKLPKGIYDFSSYMPLCELLKKEFSEEIAKKIMYKNVMRVFSSASYEQEK